MKIKYFLFIALLANTHLFAGPVVNTHISTYKIQGNTADQLRQEMNNKGPVIDGVRYDSHYNWYVKWHYDYHRHHGLCYLKNVKVSVAIDEIFPAWVDMNKADPALQNKFTAYFNFLKRYAKEYEESGEGAAKAIINMLENINPMNSCNALGDSANQQADKIIGFYQQRDKIFESKLKLLPEYTNFP